MKEYVADFETTTIEDDCRVWAYAICEVGNKDNIIIGTTIDDFLEWCKNQKDNVKIYFHNLKFDAQFIIHKLFTLDYQHVVRGEQRTKTFTTLISDKGLYYQMEIFFQVEGKKVNKVTIQDSLKLIPLSVDAIAKSFKLPVGKLSIDYTAHDNLPVGSPLTPDEEEYIKQDVRIVAHAIEYFHSQGLNKMTIGSCALDEYKKLVTRKNFKRWYPPPQYHNDVKQSYRGGFTYLNPEFAGKKVGNGIVLDVNSLYPSVMYQENLPFGTALFFEGEYQKDDIYPLYIQMFRCQFELKPGKIPTIQIKYGSHFSGNEYLTSSNGEEVVLCLTSVDMELFREQYNIYNIEYFSGWKFKSSNGNGLFGSYIDKWSANKINAKKEGNPGLYLISKLFLNSLYGKFGSDTRVKAKIPYFDEGVVKYYDGEAESKDGVFIAMASFITAYARRKTITSAQRIMNNYNAGKSDIQFIYADTDSLHCVSPNHELPQGLEIDDTKLGAWKYELKFKEGKYLRQKCYMELGTEEVDNPDAEYVMKVTVAGMPKNMHEQVTFDNFELGASYTGKVQPKIVPGGVILRDVDFTIKK